MSRKVIRYVPAWSDHGRCGDDTQIGKRTPPFGYTHLGFLLAREGMKLNQKKLLRI